MRWIHCRLILCFIALAWMFAGCGGTVSVRPPSVQPVVAPLPISVGVYYADDLKHHKCTGDQGYIAYAWTIELGPSSIELFDNVFRALFADIEILETDHTIAPLGDRKGVVDIHLSKFTGCDASWPIVNTTVIEVAYEAILRSAEDEVVAQWEGRGQAGPGDDLSELQNFAWEPELAHLAALTNVAMRKAATDFIIEFETNTAIQNWVRN